MGEVTLAKLRSSNCLFCLCHSSAIAAFQLCWIFLILGGGGYIFYYFPRILGRGGLDISSKKLPYLGGRVGKKCTFWWQLDQNDMNKFFLFGGYGPLSLSVDHCSIKWGETASRGRGLPILGTPPSGCLLHLPLFVFFFYCTTCQHPEAWPASTLREV